jgi:uncharacterized protein (TIGR03435 family)
MRSLGQAGVGVACLAIIATNSVSLKSQQEPAAAAATTPAAQRDLRFEVASIHLGDPSGVFRTSVPLTPSDTRFTTFGNVAFLTQQAFGLKQKFQIVSKPGVNSTQYVIQATLPEGATKADIPLMLQHLLEDRFGLVYHRESRPMEGYRLVVAKSGPKVTKSSGNAPNPDDYSFKGITRKDDIPQFPANMRSLQMMTTKGLFWHGHYRTMQELVSDLAMHLKAPVIDATGLDGPYDYNLSFMTDEMLSKLSEGDTGNFPDLYLALESELGLKLVPVKAVSVEVIVIDSALKLPTEN